MFIEKDGNPTTIDKDILDEYATVCQTYKVTGLLDPASRKPPAKQALRDEVEGYWKELGQAAIDRGELDHLKEDQEQATTGIIEGPFNGETLDHPERVDETTALISQDIKVAAALQHRWAMAVNDHTQFLSYASVQRDEWGRILKGAEEHQKTFEKVYGEFLENVGTQLKHGLSPEQALNAVKSVQQTALKMAHKAAKSSKENSEEAMDTLTHLMKRARDEQQQTKPEMKKEQKTDG